MTSSREKNKTQERNFYESLVILRTLEEWVTCESLWLWDLNCGMTKSINKTLKELIFFRLNFPFFGDCYIVVHSVFEISRAERCQPSQWWAGWCQSFHQILLTSLTLTIFPHLRYFAKPWFFDTKHLSRHDHLLPFSLLMDGATLLQRKICLFSHPISD